jgi:hypothetical protein
LESRNIAEPYQRIYGAYYRERDLLRRKFLEVQHVRVEDLGYRRRTGQGLAECHDGHRFAEGLEQNGTDFVLD